MNPYRKFLTREYLSLQKKGGHFKLLEKGKRKKNEKDHHTKNNPSRGKK